MRNRSDPSRSWLLALLLMVLPTAALADVPMFLVFAYVRVMFWWTILVAIAIEAAALFGLFDLSWRRAIVAAVVVNIGTALMGFVVYPLVGMLTYPVLAPLVADVFGTGQIVEMAAYCVVAAVVDTPIELGLLVLLSAAAGFGVQIGRKAAAVFFMANLISAAVLFVAIEIGPRQMPVDAETQDMLATEFGEEVAFVERVFEALPDHLDEEGKVDPAWRDGLRHEAERLAFLELMIGTSEAQYSLVALPLREVGSGYGFRYEADQYDGAIRVTRGTIQSYSSAQGGDREVMQVLHYHMRGDGPEPVPVVRATFLLSRQD